MKMRESILACTLSVALVAAPLAGCASNTTSSASSSQQDTSVSVANTEATNDDQQFVLYLGTNDKDTNQPVYSREESKERAKAILMKIFGGYTIQEAEGGWKSNDGTEYQEYTLVIHLSDTTIDKVHVAARELIDEFHQSSVLINTERVQTEFYDGK